MALNLDQLAVLTDELANDPLGRGYSGMTDQQAADDIATEYVNRDRELIPNQAIYEAIDPAEYDNLRVPDVNGVTKLGDLNAITAMQDINIQAPNTRANLNNVFKPNADYTQTRLNLAALQTETVTRAVDLSIPEPTADEVNVARS